MDKYTTFNNVLAKYLPDAFIPYICDLLLKCNVKFKIVAPRRSKLGDFRSSNRHNEKCQISINGNLNPYAFLITTLHEIAHLNTFNHYGNRVSPHGKEWKTEFASLLEPILNNKQLPNDLKKVLEKSIKNLKASSYSDIELSRILKKYDSSEGTYLLEDLNEDCLFELNKKVYSKGKLRRTRYLCKEISSGKSYLVHALAEVNRIE
tara:strand:- start:101 stop:718 length:618 start_codon:yes stop_codon:yes gene_type:complete